MDVGGSIAIPADSVAMMYWLKWLFGDPTTSGSDPYTHEYKIGNTMPSAALEMAFTDLATNAYSRFLGCKVSSFAMSFGGDGELTAEISVVGANHSMETSAMSATPTAISIARVNNFSAALTEGGSALSVGTELSINVDFGLDTGVFVIGGNGVRGSIPEGIVSVSGNLKTIFDDTSLLAKAENGTETSLTVTVTESASSILELELQELRYERNAPPVDGPQGLSVDLNFQGYYDDGSEASAIVARVTNSESALATAA
jgi:hypothetical protein